MRPHALCLALALASTPLVAGDIITSEVPISTEVVEAVSGNPSVAVGATKSYVVWNASGDLFGAELSASGETAVDTRRRLGAVTASSTPRAWAAGDTFFVDGTDKDGAFLRRVDGGVTLRNVNLTALLYNGSRILLLSGASAELRDLDLNVVVPSFDFGFGTSAASVAGDKFVLLSGTSLYVVDNDGHVQKLPPTLVSGVSSSGLAANASEIVYAWTYFDGTHLYAQRYSLNGTALSDVFDVTPLTGGRISSWRLVSGAGEVFAEWTDSSGMYVRRISGTGGTATLVTDRVYTDDTFHGLPAIAGGPAAAFALWTTPAESQRGPTRVIRRIDSSGDPQPLALGLADQSQLRVASDGSLAVAAWIEHGRVRAGRVDKDRGPLDGGGLLVAPELSADQEVDDVVFDGINYLVLFRTDILNVGRRLYARILKRDGTFLTNTLPVTALDDSVLYASAFWTGSTYRVVWTTGRGALKMLFTDIASSGLVSAPVQMGLAVNVLYDEPFSIVWGQRPLYLNSRYEFGVFLDSLKEFDLPGDPGRSSFGARGATNDSNVLIAWASQTPYPSPGPFTRVGWIARYTLAGERIDVPLGVAVKTVANIGDPSFAGPIPLRVGAGYRLVIVADTIKVAKITDSTFLCRCLDDTVETPLPYVSSIAAAPAGPDAVAIAYARSATEPGLGTSQRAFLRYARPAPTPRHRAARP